MGDRAEQDDPEKEILALRPMTCPFQFQAYLNRRRILTATCRCVYNETSTLFRNEASGEMHGLDPRAPVHDFRGAYRLHARAA